ncbi:MAG: S-layer protein, partial [Candidatus Micrarchaeia archaeon]
MKSINAKKIAAITAGAALLGIGLAFAGPVSFQNVPIISNSGQPLVQIVIGSQAKPSDGVAAANIAAAIGNLAFTTVPVTAKVNTTEAQSVLHVAVTGANYTLVNPQVWLNESGTALSSGTYGFSALIGSVLNGAVP